MFIKKSKPISNISWGLQLFWVEANVACVQNFLRVSPFRSLWPKFLFSLLIQSSCCLRHPKKRKPSPFLSCLKRVIQKTGDCHNHFPFHIILNPICRIAFHHSVNQFDVWLNLIYCVELWDGIRQNRNQCSLLQCQIRIEKWRWKQLYSVRISLNILNLTRRL